MFQLGYGYAVITEETGCMELKRPLSCWTMIRKVPDETFLLQMCVIL